MNQPGNDAKNIFLDALGAESAADREELIQAACGGDADLLSRVRKLFVAHEESSGPLDCPPTAVASPPPSVTESVAGNSVGPYKLLQQIGEGGFGIVYMAEQTKPVRRKVALKVIKPGMDTKEVIGRFEAERQALAMMDHPNIAKVLDAGSTESGRPFFVMELVSGIPITEYCDTAKLDTRQRLELFAKVCQAVQHAHQKGVIHRDIKPSNVLVTEHDGEPVPKVIDFGVAKAINQQLTERTVFTRFQQMIGTPMYMSPEQASLSGLDIDTRSDIYSLGVLLYELLTGMTPFDKQRLNRAAYDEICRIIREEEPPKPSTKISTMGDQSTRVAGARKTDANKLRHLMRGELDWIVMKAMEKDRKRRYETANGLARDIHRYLEGEAVHACPPSSIYRIRKFALRNKAVLTAVSLVTLALLLGLIATSAQTLKARAAERESKVSAQEAIYEAQRAEEEAQRAEQNRRVAEQNARRLQRELQVSNVARLAAQSERIRRSAPMTSALLAMEAVNVARQIGDPAISVAQETLLAATSSLGGMPLPGNKAAISPDSRWLATSGDGIQLLDLSMDDPTESPIEVSGPQSAATSLAISRDSHWLTVGTSSGSLYICDLNSSNPGAAKKLAQEHKGEVSAITTSDDGRWLVSGSDDASVLLWDLNSPESINAPVELRGHGEGIRDLQISSDSKWLMTRSERFLLLWELSDAMKSEPAFSREFTSSDFHRQAFSPDGRWLVMSDVTVADLVDLTVADSHPSRVRRLQHRVRIMKLSISNDSKWLATTTDEGMVYLWDLSKDDPSESPTLLKGHRARTLGIRFCADSEKLVTAGYDNSMRVWDLTDEDPSARPLVMHRNRWLQGLTISDNGRWLVAGGYDRKVQLHDLDFNDPAAFPVVLTAGDMATPFIEMSRDQKWLVTRTFNATMRLWRINIDDPAASPTILRSDLRNPKISANGRWLVTAIGKTARVTDLSDDNPAFGSRLLSGHEGRVNAVSINADGRWVATASDDGTARLWDLSSSNPSDNSLAFGGHGGIVKTAEVSPDGRWLVSSGGEVTFLWDLASDDPASSPRRLLEHSPFVGMAPDFPTPVAFSPDGTWLVVGAISGERNVYLWNLAGRNGISEPKLLDGPSGSVAFSADGRWLAQGRGGGVGTIRLWDLTDEDLLSPTRELTMFKGGPLHIAFGPSSRWLAGSSANLNLSLWDLQSSDATDAPIVLRGHTASAFGGLKISPDGRLISGSQDGTARVWDLTSKNPAEHCLTLRAGVGRVTSVAASSSQRWIVTQHWNDGTARLWDLDIDSAMDRAQRLVGRELTKEERQLYQLDD